MKRLLFLCALTLSMLLLAGCVPAMVITSPRNAEFQEAWEDSIDESAEEWAGDWEAAWESAWDGIRTSRDPDNENKAHYWKITGGEDQEIGTVTDEEQVAAIDDLLSDDGQNWGRRPVQDAGEPAYSYIFCQEKTLLAGQDPSEEREYQELVRFAVSASEDAVTLYILEDLTVLPGVDLGGLLTFAIDIPAETAEALRNPSVFLDA
ncbi:MAG: hypothetical protein HFG00_08130 [Oscillibacter sp.]|nr:hypothetical protein [Oscillibacter sp.]